MSRLLLAASALLVLSGCASSGEEPPTPRAADPAAACASIPISRFQELTIVDEAVVGDARSRNDAGGPWSFRYAVEQMAPPGVAPEDFVRDWLDSWLNSESVNLFPVTKRVGVVPHAICPWLKRTPENACDADCKACAGQKLDLAQAPFRLIAIVNRTDLREQDATEPAGEGRLVFAFVDGAGDDPAAVSQEMTVIFEYKLPDAGGRDIKYWAERWHELGASAAFDEAYKEKLRAITDEFVKRGAAPGAPGDSALAQIRVNELHFSNWPWQLREYHLGESGLGLAPTRNTPDQSLNFSDALKSFVSANREAILEGKHLLPPALTGGMAEAGFKWQMPGVDEALRKAFAKETCNGCHQGETQSIDTHFHISPKRAGVDKLSPFVNNPADPSADDLARREQSMRRGLCGK